MLYTVINQSSLGGVLAVPRIQKRTLNWFISTLHTCLQLSSLISDRWCSYCRIYSFMTRLILAPCSYLYISFLSYHQYFVLGLVEAPLPRTSFYLICLWCYCSNLNSFSPFLKPALGRYLIIFFYSMDKSSQCWLPVTIGEWCTLCKLILYFMPFFQ